MAMIIVKNSCNGGKATVCHLSGKVLRVSCSKGCYENGKDGKECEFYSSHYPFCEKAGEFMAEYEEESKEAE